MPPKWSNKRTSTNKHSDPDSDEDYDPLNLSSDEESEIIKPLQRMTIKQTTTMDPPRNGNGPRALVRMAEMKCRDTDVQREHGMLLIIDKLEGVHPEDIHVTCCLKDKRMTTLEWNSCSAVESFVLAPIQSIFFELTHLSRTSLEQSRK
jgi:hypothetical protein